MLASSRYSPPFGVVPGEPGIAVDAVAQIRAGHDERLISLYRSAKGDRGAWSIKVANPSTAFRVRQGGIERVVWVGEEPVRTHALIAVPAELAS